ncbi:hypothetical protein SBDP1_1590035 [Syntrophobacter sp. SbD1]|nr:hypothetical protein SBDP1_1590035 [Syntrophobacter sp. SbD1]
MLREIRGSIASNSSAHAKQGDNRASVSTSIRTVLNDKSDLLIFYYPSAREGAKS